MMFEKLKDRNIQTLLMIGKRGGAYPFIRDPRGMIALRNEAAKRGIYATKGEEERAVMEVMRRLEDPDDGVKWGPRRKPKVGRPAAAIRKPVQRHQPASGN
jgi:hypothetical protein